MIRRWPALTYYLYALRLAALSHFYFNPLYFQTFLDYAHFEYNMQGRLKACSDEVQTCGPHRIDKPL